MKLLSAIESLITVLNRKYEMKSFCLKYKKDIENIYPRVSNTTNNKTMILWKCSTWFINQEAKGLLSSLGLRKPLSKVPLLGDILFWMQFHWKIIKWMK